LIPRDGRAASVNVPFAVEKWRWPIDMAEYSNRGLFQAPSIGSQA
jgi:hypothetical protein